jgi:hypothetical protein
MCKDESRRLIVAGVLSGRGKTPLARSFRFEPAGPDPVQFESFSVYGDVMVVPAECAEIGRIMVPTSCAGIDVMDFEPIMEGAVFDDTSSVPGEDESSDLVGNGAGAAQIEELTCI